jgi:O-antigen/teichoic acid export membrane protein
MANEPERFRNAYLRLVSTLFLINFLLAAALIVFAEVIVRVLLGHQWMEIVPLLRILAVAGFVRSVVAIGGRALYAVGTPRWDSLVSATRLVVLAVTLVPFVGWRGLEGAALAVLVSAVLIIPVYLFVIRRVVSISPGEHLSFALGYYRRMTTEVRRIVP